MKRLLVVNADDFGRATGINHGVARAHEDGIVTSASLMVRWPAATEAAQYARTHPALSLGLHVDLGEWEHRGGQDWTPVYEREHTAAEIHCQLEAFRQLVGADPTHIDSHQHVHRDEPIRSAVLELGRKLNVPVRHYSSIRHEGGFYGQDEKGAPWPAGIGVANLVGILRALPEGATELCCHPGLGDDYASSYGPERERETEALCDLSVKRALVAAGIELRSFRDLGT